jgi:hypothetical protein
VREMLRTGLISPDDQVSCGGKWVVIWKVTAFRNACPKSLSLSMKRTVWFVSRPARDIYAAVSGVFGLMAPEVRATIAGVLLCAALVLAVLGCAGVWPSVWCWMSATLLAFSGVSLMMIKSATR